MDPIYSDKFITIYQNKLVIKWFYFPFVLPKRISISQIEHFDTHADLDLAWQDYKAWGMAMNDIWWACDMSRVIGPWGRWRNLKYTCGIVRVQGEWGRKGFSMENDEAVDILKNLVAQSGGGPTAKSETKKVC